MSFLTPRQTPEQRSQPFDHEEPSSPSPVNPVRALGRTLYGPFLPSPSQSDITESGEVDEDEVQSTISSSSGRRNPTKRSLRQSILAHFKNSRERQNARVSRVDRLISFIEKIQHEKYVGRNEVISKQLFPKDYIELLVEVEERDRNFQLFFHHGLRYEYRESIHGKEQFTVFMLSAFHISMQKSIDHKLLTWRDAIKSNEGYSTESRTAAEKIDSTRDQKMEFVSNKTLRGDCSFIYEEENYTHPTLIFEIAWSQSTDKLEERAMELIEEGNGQIRTVVGLDFFETWNIWNTIRDQIGNGVDPIRGPFTAFVWRVVFDRNGHQVFNANGRPRVRKSNHLFCDYDGTANLTESLQLSLRDFLPALVIKEERWGKVKDLDNVKLELDTSTMLTYFDDALKKQKREDENSKHKIERIKEETKKQREERAAKRKADSEKEHKRWDISSFIEIGGHRLRKVQGRA